ncbi:MAG TPA: ATP-binding protein [Aliidongia sp.]|nr:ATP-binding protein [Aliidongia sp.]
MTAVAGLRDSWPLGLAWRLALLVAALIGLGELVIGTQFYASMLIAGLLVAILFAEILRYTTASDRELARVIDAIGQGDFADRPVRVGRHGAATPLAQAFTRALDLLRQRNSIAEAHRARLATVVEHAPVPLLAIEETGSVELLNRAARRLFEGAEVTRRSHLLALAPELEAALMGPPGRHMLRLALPRGPQRCLVSVARSISVGRSAAIVSLQNIQDELEAIEIRAWEDLVRVLAHEIMNSLTPVSSLAQTASLLVEDLRAEHEGAALDELDEAVGAIARRSGGLMRFVEGYRRFAEPPTPIKRQIPVEQLFDRVQRLAASLLADADVRIETEIVPQSLAVEADPDLMDQVLLNLVKNAADAARGGNEALIRLSAALDARGRVVLGVTDNGPGLTPELIEHIFVPFFTTKPKGSGIGLPVVRQIMLAHGGSVEAVPGTPGATFRLVF